MSSTWKNLSTQSGIVQQMTWRAIREKYQGTFFGFLWPFMTPLFMLTVYTFVFSSILPMRWSQGDQSFGTVAFAIVLFYGLAIHTYFVEVMTQSPTMIVANANFVKKIVFPLGTLSVIASLASFFHLIMTLLLIVVFQVLFLNTFSVLSLAAPLFILPCLFMAMGLAWLLSAVGTYFRDLGQIVTPLMTALLFLGPVLYPVSAVPEAYRQYVYLNPVTFPTEQLRLIMVWNEQPDWLGLSIYSSISLCVFLIGRSLFNFLRSGFADVV